MGIASVLRAGVMAGLSALGIGGACAPAMAVPPGFLDREVAPGEWNQAVGITFDANGRGYVWEKAGRVWLLENDQKSATPLIDISEEVGDWRDYGLVGFALDPNFLTNGYVYMLYTVDFHYLMHFGTPEYDPQANEYFRDTIGRLTRYTATAESGRTVVDPASRLVLIGQTISSGFAHCHQSHGVGTLNFAEDGTLLISDGEGASYETTDLGGYIVGSSNTAFADGILSVEENVGAFRSQLLNCLNGRILRIDPATGNGVPSNPFYDPANPGSARSKTWVLGLRNPYRWTIRPESGSHHAADGDPGTLYIGDVGWFDHEELNVAPTGGLNFGWPAFEGFTRRNEYLSDSPLNLQAPNPLFGVNGCTQQFLRFRDLIIEDTLAPSWPNPCDPSQQIMSSATAPVWMHTRPALDWRDGQDTRVPTFAGNDAATAALGAPGSPVAGEGYFPGSASTGGAWYVGTRYPAAYQNSYYHGDFSGGWIKQMLFDSEDRLLEVRPFVSNAGAVVDVEYNPVDEALYYINYNQMGVAAVRRIGYGTLEAPIAVAQATPPYGPLPLTVQFSSLGSVDPEALPLTFEWDFGDGTPTSREANPMHTYSTLLDVTALGTPAARIFSFTPPNPTGGGNADTAVWRDGVWPPVGNEDSSLQYDTYHGNDQGGGVDSDWVGYTFASEHRLTQVIFQEGRHFVDGGWFSNVRVEVRVGGVWVNVSGASVTPAYPGINDGESFEVYTFLFRPVMADGVRIIGNAGGSSNFISVGELRAFELPLDQTGPRRHDVVMRATDPGGLTTAAGVVVSPNNSPPVVQITSPMDGWLFCAANPTPIDLRATISDAEHGSGQLSCRWEPILHHNGHLHPEPIVTTCDASALINAHGDTADRFWFEFVLTVTDAQGLSTRVTSSIYPSCCPGTEGEGPLLSPDCNSNGVPDSCEGAATDCNANHVPDRCDALSTTVHRFDGDSPDGFSVNGTAAIVGGAARLTRATAPQQGSIVRPPLRPEPTGRFRATFDFRIGGGTGADGFCFAMLNSEFSETSLNFDDECGIVGAFAVRFDTYASAAGETGNNVILTYGGVPFAWEAPPFQLDDNRWHRVVVDILEGRVAVRITDDPPTWITVFDWVPIPGFAPAVWLAGFGARCGGLTNEHWVDNVVFSVPNEDDLDGNGYPDSCNCRADFDLNEAVAVPDIFSFLSAWFAQDPRADLDGTPGIAVPDIFAFLSLWFAGCG